MPQRLLSAARTSSGSKKVSRPIFRKGINPLACHSRNVRSEGLNSPQKTCSMQDFASTSPDLLLLTFARIYLWASGETIVRLHCRTIEQFIAGLLRLDLAYRL